MDVPALRASLGSGSSGSAGTANIGAAAAASYENVTPWVMTFTYRQCLEPCQRAGSKPQGRDPACAWRTFALTTAENHEKRVARRPDPKDPLRVFWNSLLQDKQKYAAWSRRMKKRKQGEQKDISMDEVIEEVMRFELQYRERVEYISFATIVDEYPLELWKI